MVLESSTKPGLGLAGLVWQKIQELLTQDAKLLGMVGVNNLELASKICEANQIFDEQIQ